MNSKRPPKDSYESNPFLIERIAPSVETESNAQTISSVKPLMLWQELATLSLSEILNSGGMNSFTVEP